MKGFVIGLAVIAFDRFMRGGNDSDRGAEYRHSHGPVPILSHARNQGRESHCPQLRCFARSTLTIALAELLRNRLDQHIERLRRHDAYQPALVRAMLKAAQAEGGNLIEIRDAAKSIAAGCEIRFATRIAAPTEETRR